MERALNSLQGGSAPRNTERPVKLQFLQSFAVDRFEEGKFIRSKKDQAIYVGISNPTDRLAAEDAEKKDKKDKKGQSTAGSKQNKFPRKIEDKLLLVVAAQIYGKQVRALIDSGATHCFITPSCVEAVGLKGTPRDIFLELGNGGEVPQFP